MPLLALDEVTRVFPGQENPALDSVSLTVYRGDFVAIVGPSGSGKSTLLNILGLLDHPSSGRYSIDGTDVTRLRSRELDHLRSHHFGFVFQSSHVLGDESPLSNAAMGLRIQGGTSSTAGTASD
ncbi:ATP-binding cassette domain-containing protein [Arthrobacter woluwensis]|uniref:ATP-binding cassette domain-containing protein n=1 Tax=Arthrobacter woluwensis TaxID=156980 RepID=UPI001AF2B3BF|nr:ATP-binding cassette domain-containing protein [Arthrobacter woluwensis]QTF71084.1 ATP-binding cassette domain-containing protein [Arthrobacter woluwensis]